MSPDRRRHDPWKLGDDRPGSRPIGFFECSSKGSGRRRLLPPIGSGVAPVDNRSQRDEAGGKRLSDRLDPAAGEMHVVLLLLAVGLAVLDLTRLFAFTVPAS